MFTDDYDDVSRLYLAHYTVDSKGKDRIPKVAMLIKKRTQTCPCPWFRSPFSYINSDFGSGRKVMSDEDRLVYYVRISEQLDIP